MASPASAAVRTRKPDARKTSQVTLRTNSSSSTIRMLPTIRTTRVDPRAELFVEATRPLIVTGITSHLRRTQILLQSPCLEALGHRHNHAYANKGLSLTSVDCSSEGSDRAFRFGKDRQLNS